MNEKLLELLRKVTQVETEVERPKDQKRKSGVQDLRSATPRCSVLLDLQLHHAVSENSLFHLFGV